MPRLSISRFGLLLCGLIALLACLAVSVDTVGIYEDEGIYDSTAQSLIDGKGYHISTLPGSPPNAKYPFLYPAWLALLKWMVPGAGIWKDTLLKLSNLPILMIFVWVFYRTLRDQFQWPIEACQLTAALTGICGTVMPFTLAMMTEIPFMLVVWILLRELLFLGSANRKPRWWLVFAMGVAVYYLRTAGVAILAAVIAVLILHKLKREAAFLLVGWMLSALPWVIWSRHAAAEFSSQQPVLSKLLAYYLTYDYHTGALLQAAHEDGWLSAAGFFLTIVCKNIVTLVKGLGEIFFPATLIYAGSMIDSPPMLEGFSFVAGLLITGFAAIGYRASEIRNKSVLGLAVTFHIALFIVWPWPFASRFLTPIVPIIVIFVAENVRQWSDHWLRLRVVLIATSFLLQVWTLGSLMPGGTLLNKLVLFNEPAYQDALAWLKPRITKSDIVFSGFTSQWVSRELGVPVVRYNTILSPKTGLKLQFKIDPSNPAYADEFTARLRDWRLVVPADSGHLWIFAEVSLDNASWQTIQTQMLRNQLRLVWDKELQPVKIFEAVPSQN